MVQLTLEGEEREVLAGALRSYLSDLRSEIAGTDAFDMKEGLKRQEETLERILARVDGGGGAGGGPAAT